MPMDTKDITICLRELQLWDVGHTQDANGTKREIFIYQKGAKGQGIATGEYIK
jgi:hypothetical protein